MATAAASSKKDVGLLYHHHDDADNEKANELRAALEMLGLTVSSLDDASPAGYKLTNPDNLAKHSRCVVIIVTEAYVSDPMDEFGWIVSLQNSIPKGLFNVIPVKYTDTGNIPNELKVITGIGGSLSLDDKASKIQACVESIKKQELEIKIDECKTKAQNIIDCAMKILCGQYDIDGKMKQLHQKIKKDVERKVGNDPTLDIHGTDCSCQRGEEWKKEIEDKKHWAIDPAEPFNNIKKAGADHATKHTADVHDLYESAECGYKKLASVFLCKIPKTKKTPKTPKTPDHRDPKINLYGYLDHARLIQLLWRCKVFDISKEKIEKLGEARNKVAHSPAVLTTAEQRMAFLNDVIQLVHEDCRDLLSHENMEILEIEVEQLRQATVTAIVQGHHDESTHPDEGASNVQRGTAIVQGHHDESTDEGASNVQREPSIQTSPNESNDCCTRWFCCARR